jgi:5-methyltetrahydropteroyltriglutamate--homocysteine methyltransferase
MSSSKFMPRADHVGSLLRPEIVANARKAYFETKTITADQLKEAEDKAILDLIAMQQEVGLKVATDGEARRSFWHYDYMGALDGLDLEERDEGVQFAGIKLRPIHPVDKWQAGFSGRSPNARSLQISG